MKSVSILSRYLVTLPMYCHKFVMRQHRQRCLREGIAEGLQAYTPLKSTKNFDFRGKGSTCEPNTCPDSFQITKMKVCRYLYLESDLAIETSSRRLF